MENRLRILAVDDSSVSLATIEQELGSKYEVITMNSGTRALRYLSKQTPDLILLDIQMAQKSGIETLKEIRAMENGASIPVIMLTSKKDKETVLESSKLGALDYILKPFKAQYLQERIALSLRKAGVISVEDGELLDEFEALQKELEEGNTQNAAVRMSAILGFKIDGEIWKRVEKARTKLAAREQEAALRMVERILKMLEKRAALEEASAQSSNIFVGLEVIRAWILCILYDLENFRVREAAQKLEEFITFPLPHFVEEACRKAWGYLDEYDDGTAEELLKETLEDLR